MKNFLRALPVEAYVLLVPVCIFFLCITIFALTCHGGWGACGAEFLQGHFLATIFDGKTFTAIIVPLFAYTACTLFIMWLRKNKESTATVIVQNLRSFFFVFGIFYLATIATAFSVQLLFNGVDPIHAGVVSNKLMALDKIFFGVYPTFYLQTLITNDVLGFVIVKAYAYLIPVVLLLTVVLVFSKTLLFRKFILAYFIAGAIGIPFWILVPAVSPSSMYRLNELHMTPPVAVMQSLEETKFTPYMTSVFEKLDTYWRDPSGKSLNITAFPSMHAAWGIVVAVIAIELWAPLALLVIPWVLAELVGTVYTLQHYAIDTVFGILVGLGALYLSRKILGVEGRYFTDRYDLFASLREFQRQAKKLFCRKKKTG